jgi:DNA-nicking Smr family endonuclease
MARASLGFANLSALREQLRRNEEDRLREQQEEAERAARAHAEANLFRSSLAGVTPLTPLNRVVPTGSKPAPLPRQTELDEQAALAESLSDGIDTDSLLETDENLSWRRDGIGADIVRRLRRGHWVLDDQIDLHGARRDEARTLLATFLRDCIKRNMRCVRVVHGKGHGSVGRQPVLKGKVRGWLMQKDEVLAFCQARAADGGSGALLVLLRS